MKGFLKGAAIVALCIFIMGLGLTITGAVLGGSLVNISWNNGKVQILDWEFDGFNWNNNWDYTVRTITGGDETVSGHATNEKVNNMSNVKSLEFSLGAAEVFVTLGDSYSFKSVGRWKYDVRMSGSTWIVKLDQHNLRMKINNDEKVYITIPKDAVFDDVNVEMGAGKITIEGLTTRDLSFDVGAGKLDASNIVCTNEASFTVGMAQMDVRGIFEGETQLECGMGQIILELDEKPESYGYEVEVGMGQAKIFDESFNGIADRNYNEGEKVFFDVEVGMGQITIK